MQNKKWEDCVEGYINSTVSLRTCSPDNVRPTYRDNSFSTTNAENSDNSKIHLLLVIKIAVVIGD